ncbi:MAG TPA: hypothetical protein VIF34_04960 [Methylocystis sp.]|jgi:hypothetical protein
MDNHNNAEIHDVAKCWSWKKSHHSQLRYPFRGASKIKENYSQAFQDLFVLSMLDGVRSGTYLEIGAQEPCSNNNTCLLHREFGWGGLSIELDPVHLSTWKKERPRSRLLIADALSLDYSGILSELVELGARKSGLPSLFSKLFPSGQKPTNRIDYLQLDIDPSINTLGVLKLLPLSDFRFSVITFETDVYTGDLRAQAESRALLLDHGYKLVGADVSVLYEPVSPRPVPFEDWWVDPLIIDDKKITKLSSLAHTAVCPQDIIFER